MTTELRGLRALKYASKCEECGAHLPAGTLAKLQHRNGRWVAYGQTCHTHTDETRAREAGPPRPEDVPGYAEVVAAIRANGGVIVYGAPIPKVPPTQDGPPGKPINNHKPKR